MALVLAGMVALVLVAGVVVFWSGDGSNPIEQQWVSDTANPINGNHHAVAATRIDGTPMVFAPISGAGDTKQCALMGLWAANGSVRWADRVPPQNCTIHAVADPAVADLLDDESLEVIAATTQETVNVHDPSSGDVKRRYPLSTYGYSRPLVADVAGDPDPELVAVDVRGSVFVVYANGSTVWAREFSSFTWGQPAVADVDSDGQPDLTLALGRGDLYLFDAGTGVVKWNRSLGVLGTVTWMTTAQADHDPQLEIILATTRGRVMAYDGRNGQRSWTRQLGEFAAVKAVGDGDGDGRPEVYVSSEVGVVHALNGIDGSLEWRTSLTDEPEQMMPPPVMGDLDADGTVELVVATNEGRLALLDAGSGRIVASRETDGRFWTNPTLADTDDDGRPEIYVMFGNGRVGKFVYTSEAKDSRRST